jgi:hypothetical protein
MVAGGASRDSQSVASAKESRRLHRQLWRLEPSTLDASPPSPPDGVEIFAATDSIRTVAAFVRADTR